LADSNKNRAEYWKRVNRVVDYIEAHRAEELSLETLAGVAAFSPYHFHRIFKAVIGENLREFIQRVRLESAASQLVAQPQAEILRVAVDNGFSSASAFARAFKDRFGMTASAWRGGGFDEWSKCRQADSKPGEADRKAGKAEPGAPALHPSGSGDGARRDPEETMSVTVKTLPTHHVAYVRNVGPYGPDGIGPLWQRLKRWAEARDLWTADRVCIGIAYDDPRVTEPARCRYDAAIVVPGSFAADGDINVVDLPGGKFATIDFTGTLDGLGGAWEQMFAWLPDSGFQPDQRPAIELYRGEAYDPATGRFTFELCMAVQPL